MSDMTIQTPQSLRARASMLALRLQEMGIDQAELLAATAELSRLPPPPSFGESARKRVNKACILADLASRSNSTVCDACLACLQPEPQISTSVMGRGEKCVLCQFDENKPESFAKPFCDFLREHPTVWHAVDYFKRKLIEAGYEEASSRDNWHEKLVPGGKYFTTRNGTSLIAFAVGKAYRPGNGVAMIAGHIDALSARLKPLSDKPTREGFVQLGVAPYAGALNETWWDRDLSIGGRVIVRDDKTGKTHARLVKIDWPIARIPSLAPHLGRGMLSNNNPETEAVPVIGLDNSDITGNAVVEEKSGSPGSFVHGQPSKLVKLVSNQLDLSNNESIVNWDLELYDSQPAQLGGMDREFIFAGRIDDKLCSWSALIGLLAAEHSDSEDGIKLVALFDNEEIGSLLRQGARGNFLPITIERAVEALSAHWATKSEEPNPFGPGVIGQTFARSFLVSADVTHSINPNFAHLYLPNHTARLNVGITLCTDSNGHMTSDAVSGAIVRRVGELGGGVVQTFQTRNDSRSGGTVGPMLSSAMGVRAADVGSPQLSMHSIRATTGSLDPGLGVKFFRTFLDKWVDIDREWH